MSRLTDNESYCLMRCADDYKGMETIEENCKLYKACFERKMYDKLKHYEDLEEQGRLIELPCKVGDKVWEIHHRAWEGYADDWLYPDYTRSIVQECGFSLSLLSSIGSTIFLTKAEAEAKLAELKVGTE